MKSDQAFIFILTVNILPCSSQEKKKKYIAGHKHAPHVSLIITGINIYITKYDQTAQRIVLLTYHLK